MISIHTFSSNFYGDLLFLPRRPSSVRSHERSDKLLPYMYKRTLPWTEGGRRVVGWAERGTDRDQGEAGLITRRLRRRRRLLTSCRIVCMRTALRVGLIFLSFFRKLPRVILHALTLWSKLRKLSGVEEWFLIMFPSFCKHNEILRCF